MNSGSRRRKVGLRHVKREFTIQSLFIPRQVCILKSSMVMNSFLKSLGKGTHSVVSFSLLCKKVGDLTFHSGVYSPTNAETIASTFSLLVRTPWKEEPPRGFFLAAYTSSSVGFAMPNSRNISSSPSFVGTSAFVAISKSRNISSSPSFVGASSSAFVFVAISKSLNISSSPSFNSASIAFNSSSSLILTYRQI